MKLKLALAYVVMLLPSLLIAATFWSVVAPGRFYYCWDDAPFSSFIPPFAHLEYPRDHYILSKSTVYSIWFGFITVAALVPAVPVLFLGRFWRFYQKRGLFQSTREAEAEETR